MPRSWSDDPRGRGELPDFPDDVDRPAFGERGAVAGLDVRRPVTRSGPSSSALPPGPRAARPRARRGRGWSSGLDPPAFVIPGEPAERRIGQEDVRARSYRAGPWMSRSSGAGRGAVDGVLRPGAGPAPHRSPRGPSRRHVSYHAGRGDPGLHFRDELPQGFARIQAASRTRRSMATFRIGSRSRSSRMPRPGRA